MNNYQNNYQNVQTFNKNQTIEQVLIEGDLSVLSPDQRLEYYKKVCDSLGLNPMTKPFAYIRLNNKLTLYALKDCTEQLRKKHNVSLQIVSRELHGAVFVVTAKATTKERSDESIGAVSVGGLMGDALANAYMKAETKAKRRVTLSICGLGMLDDSETDSIPGATKFQENYPAEATVVGETPSQPEAPINPVTKEELKKQKEAAKKGKSAKQKEPEPVEAPPPAEEEGEIVDADWTEIPDPAADHFDGADDHYPTEGDVTKPTERQMPPDPEEPLVSKHTRQALWSKIQQAATEKKIDLQMAINVLQTSQLTENKARALILEIQQGNFSSLQGR